jgi:hypothetical protein
MFSKVGYGFEDKALSLPSKGLRPGGIRSRPNSIDIPITQIVYSMPTDFSESVNERRQQ